MTIAQNFERGESMRQDKNVYTAPIIFGCLIILAVLVVIEQIWK